ncbi:MAG: sugar ABC transporter permease [Bifidobacterium psychraerophilum]|uniref:carbohydrate ABC transporter permease n=1 Tax=Bifidobacterium psychraerophilum TaxID=218140 RepID=UPI0039EAC9B4
MTSVTTGVGPVPHSGEDPSRDQGAPRRRNKRQRCLRSNDGKTAAMLFGPTGLILIALVAVPIVFLLISSFSDFNQRSLFTGEFNIVGLRQYVIALSDSEFWFAILRTVLFTAALVLGSVLIGMYISQMMTRLNGAMRYLVTFVLIFAWAMPNVASSIVWKWLFQPGYGVVNWMLTRLRIFGDMSNTAWSNNTALALICIWMLVVWQAVPYIAITLYAATIAVDHSCLEAAQLDGAGSWRLYWQILVPMIKPNLLVVAILSVIWDFNVFNQIWLVSQGGPAGSTATIGVFTYTKAFVSFDIGQGSAIAVITMLMLLVLTGVYIRNLLKSGEDL